MNRILWNRRPTDADGGDIDELVAHNATIHIEQQSDRCWWLAITLSDGTHWAGNLTADARGHMTFSEQENGGLVWDHDDAHQGDPPMGWGSGINKDGREIGYMVAAECDQDGCTAEIDRGLSYCCGGLDGVRGEAGCGGYFCGDHLGFGKVAGRAVFLCDACYQDDEAGGDTDG